MLKIGEEVMVIPPSYGELMKHDFHYPIYWHESTGDGDEYPMLGGAYKVLDIKGEYVQVLDNAPNNRGIVYEGFLKKKSSVDLCSFRVGQKVVFSPSCDTMDWKALQGFFQYDVSDYKKTHIVTGILNNYYVFLDFGKGSIKRFPFRWIDLNNRGRSNNK